MSVLAITSPDSFLSSWPCLSACTYQLWTAVASPASSLLWNPSSVLQSSIKTASWIRKGRLLLGQLWTIPKRQTYSNKTFFLHLCNMLITGCREMGKVKSSAYHSLSGTFWKISLNVLFLIPSEEEENVPNQKLLWKLSWGCDTYYFPSHFIGQSGYVTVLHFANGREMKSITVLEKAGNIWWSLVMPLTYIMSLAYYIACRALLCFYSYFLHFLE